MSAHENATGWNENSNNAMLNLYRQSGEGFALSAHSDDPGTTGANMLENADPAAGGRVAASFGAASGGQSALTANVPINMLQGWSVRWIGRWAETAPDTWRFDGYKPANPTSPGDPVSFELDGTLTVTAHTLVIEDVLPPEE